MKASVGIGSSIFIWNLFIIKYLFLLSFNFTAYTFTMFLHGLCNSFSNCITFIESERSLLNHYPIFERVELFLFGGGN